MECMQGIIDHPKLSNTKKQNSDFKYHTWHVSKTKEIDDTRSKIPDYSNLGAPLTWQIIDMLRVKPIPQG